MRWMRICLEIVCILVKGRYHQHSSVLRQVDEIDAKLPLDGILPDDLQYHKVDIFLLWKVRW